MAVYTVHEPPRRVADTLAHTERFVFVRDGFAWSAFLFAPLWMLRHRLWLALLGYVLVVSGLMLGLRAVGASGGSGAMAYALFALLIGIEASTLRRWTLARRRWTALGVVIGDDLEAAERRFFDMWVKDADGIVSRVSPDLAPPAPRVPGISTQDVIGLFPEPGART
jgi:hypothetical protein